MKEVKETTINVLSILSIILAFTTPIAGLVLGIISLVQIKGEKKGPYVLAKKLSIMAIIIASIILVVQIALVIYTMVTAGGSLLGI